MRKWLSTAASWTLVPLLGGFLGVIMIAGTYVLVAQYGPAIESAVSPVVRFEPTTDITRDESTACFTLHIQKLHAAAPRKYVFQSRTLTSETIDVSPYMTDANHRPVRQEYVDHPVGSRWSRYYCFDISTTVADTQDIHVFGAAVHRRHPIWDSVTDIPEFVVPALVKLSTKPAPEMPPG